MDPLTLVAAGIGAATSIGNAIFGSASARKQKEEQLATLRKQKAEERAWFNRKYNEDATQRADAQRTINRVNDVIKKRTQAAMGRKAVIGGTDASIAQEQQANAEQMGNAVSDITARADAKKDAIEQSYQSNMRNLESQESAVNSNYEAARRQNMANAATGVANAAASVIANAGGETAKGKSHTTNSSTSNAGLNNAKVNINSNITPPTKQAALNEGIKNLGKTSLEAPKQGVKNIFDASSQSLQGEATKNVLSGKSAEEVSKNSLFRLAHDARDPFTQYKDIKNVSWQK